jgi:hypothetical protein
VRTPADIRRKQHYNVLKPSQELYFISNNVNIGENPSGFIRKKVYRFSGKLGIY